MNTTALFGAGLIDDISDRAIRRNSKWKRWETIGKEWNFDFKSTRPGRPHVLADGRIGKFGWKAQFATLEEFVAAACAVEVGLSNPLRRQDIPREHVEDKQAPLDLDHQQFDSLVAFVEMLPRPQEESATDEQHQDTIELGRSLFERVGCTDCHTPNLGGIRGIYSDLLLHKMSQPHTSGGYGRAELIVEIPEEHPLPIEWKTPPLWGVADTAPYFHDGASPTLDIAILRHDGDAKHVKEKYRRLSPDGQEAMITFLKTLRAPQSP